MAETTDPIAAAELFLRDWTFADLGHVIATVGGRQLTVTDVHGLLNALHEARTEREQQRTYGVGEKYKLGHGGAYCAHCRKPMREGTPVVRTTAPQCLDCAAAAPEPTPACGNCRRPFDPTDRAFDGAAEERSAPGYCRGCVDNCHEAGVGHRCTICRTLDAPAAPDGGDR